MGAETASQTPDAPPGCTWCRYIQMQPPQMHLMQMHQDSSRWMHLDASKPDASQWTLLTHLHCGLHLDESWEMHLRLHLSMSVGLLEGNMQIMSKQKLFGG